MHSYIVLSTCWLPAKRPGEKRRKKAVEQKNRKREKDDCDAKSHTACILSLYTLVFMCKDDQCLTRGWSVSIAHYVLTRFYCSSELGQSVSVSTKQSTCFCVYTEEFNKIMQWLSSVALYCNCPSGAEVGYSDPPLSFTSQPRHLHAPNFHGCCGCGDNRRAIYITMERVSLFYTISVLSEPP